MIALGHCRVEPGATVLLEVAQDKHVIGRVIWVKLDEAGVKFESDLPSEILTSLVEGEASFAPSRRSA